MNLVKAKEIMLLEQLNNSIYVIFEKELFIHLIAGTYLHSKY